MVILIIFNLQLKKVFPMKNIFKKTKTVESQQTHAPKKVPFSKLKTLLKPLTEKEYNEAYKDYYLAVVNLTKQYKKNMPPAINNLNFKVGPGEFHAFIGGNGAGKTTTIKSIVGAYAKYQGSIYMQGYLNKTAEAKRNIGYIPEIARFPEGMSTKTYLIQMAELSGVEHKAAVKFCEETLVKLKMDKLASKSPNTFSSGQKKKILLAQALVHDPKILIMDEPAANLDPRARLDFFDTLKELQKEGKSIFISSHILSELDKYATHATILDGGHIVFSNNLSVFDRENSTELLLKVDDSAQLVSYLEKEQYKFFFDNEHHLYHVKNVDAQATQKILDDLMLLKLEILLFEKFIPTLEDIYKEYVIKGSVHTMDA
ncbi:ABC transporter ATP-binding protein [Ureaplasma sp. OM1]|uniref:ABC transporter ATP-binding protein n=2 Tax=Ureaplasma ceti TaxID=3119530 RepID=A0ABP9UA65_9BACT